jgi:hypothetical protein
MKTRIIQTRFYDDEVVCELNLYAQHLYMYLLTCQYINMCGIFQLPDSKIIFESKLNVKQLEKAKEDLQAVGKILFHKGWIYVVNAEKNNKYRNSPLNETSYDREIKRVPAAIKEYFDTTIGTSIDSDIKPKPKSNPKPKHEFGIEWLEGFIERNDPLEAKELFGASVNPNFVFNTAKRIPQYMAETGKKYVDFKKTLENWINRAREKQAAKETPDQYRTLDQI